MYTRFLILESGQTWGYGVISKEIPGFLIKGPIMCSEVLGEDQLADSTAILGGGCCFERFLLKSRDLAIGFTQPMPCTRQNCPSQIHMLMLNSNMIICAVWRSETFGSWLVMENRAVTNEVSFLITEADRGFIVCLLASLFCFVLFSTSIDDTTNSCSLWKGMSAYQS